MSQEKKKAPLRKSAGSKPAPKREHPKEKTQLHPRNLHRERYDFKLLIESAPDLALFVQSNIYGDESIDFADPAAVKALNKALLKHYYGIETWDIPEGFLCPPIPGRADYVHHIADVMGASNFGKIPTGPQIVCLDIGIGANCVYPIIGNKAYKWSFIGSDIDPESITSANAIIAANPFLSSRVECRLQSNPKQIFVGILKDNEFIDLVICNPPFHASQEAAEASTLRKLSNLNHAKITEPVKNFGGKNGELWCEGGEEGFVRNMIRESRQYATACFWFSTLISKQSHLDTVIHLLGKAGATEIKTIPMGQGNKTSRIVAWSFLSKEQQQLWRDLRWKK
jgi:23S rRNA (adenine1618-N6)-methyltransferase